MPDVMLPDYFENILENRTLNDETSKSPAKRKKRVPSRAGSIFQVVGFNGHDTADVYMGFNLDGLKIYQNISSALPNLKFQFYPPPIIFSLKDVIKVDQSGPDILRIKVCYRLVVSAICVQ